MTSSPDLKPARLITSPNRFTRGKSWPGYRPSFAAPLKPTTPVAAVNTPALSFGALSIDAAARAVKIGAEEVELTAREFDLLHILATHPGHIYTRESLLSLSGDMAPRPIHTVDVHVQRLRKIPQ